MKVARQLGRRTRSPTGPNARSINISHLHHSTWMHSTRMPGAVRWMLEITQRSEQAAAQKAGRQAAKVMVRADKVGSVAHLAGPRPFTAFKPGRLPDTHLPYEMRFTRTQWDILVLYE